MWLVEEECVNPPSAAYKSSMEEHQTDAINFD